MPAISFVDLSTLALYLRDDQNAKRFTLVYAYNGTGKTRLSGEFKNLGKRADDTGITIERDTLYFNAFTEDLFSWENDLVEDRHRFLRLNVQSEFLGALASTEFDTRIRRLLGRYADFDFRIDTDVHADGRLEKAEVVFFREAEDISSGEMAAGGIKVSRGEENIFIWCFFLTVVQLMLDGSEAYGWVKYIYIDDPISSLDEHNAVMVANHLVEMLTRVDQGPRVFISTHHPLFFNVLCNELGRKARKYFLKNGANAGTFVIDDIDGREFLHHLSTLVELNELQKSGALYTHHFNMLRRVMEQTANFFGLNSWKDCVQPELDDPDKTLYERVINLMSHGDYSVFEAREMMEENKRLFRRIFRQFITIHPFNPERFPG
ncbi:AAA family ATPase [Pseudoxanthomonas mexicana]|uniref:AAA family ATPase n=1 Tax=Pseudoxanthomonas mexicana TaxID=128785 RepID=UPI001FD69124|nr:AAA family ATPase [Pseudoxanthomonas mexicana]UOV01169.1 AAA family ATPase [Pseudoxanthomonas mexicana]